MTNARTHRQLGGINRILGTDTATEFASAVRSLENRLGTVIAEHPIPPIEAIVPRKSVTSYMDCYSRQFIKVQKVISNRYGEETTSDYNRLTVACALIRFEMNQHALPLLSPELTDRFRRHLAYIARQTCTGATVDYGCLADAFLKDLRVLAGVSIPNGFQVVDIAAYLPSTFCRYEGVRENLRKLAYVHLRALAPKHGPFLRIHLDLRFMVAFIEKRYLEAHEHLATLLRTNRELRGVIGTSWFFDPNLEHVSPQLRYLWETFSENGAFMHRDGPGQENTERALAKSETRRRAYEAGTYTPCAYTVVWSRRDMLSWQERRQEARNVDRGY